jgi:2-(1,2-epoxy-1,2-dihydrophenyl)acetyl-CoA isomerase
MTDQPILHERTDGVLIATFNRPERMNTLSPDLTQALGETLRLASEDDDIRALVITGSGRAWCAGAEIGANRPGAEPSRHQRMQQSGSEATIELFARCDVPIIAALNGVAVGGGFGVALCCDVRIAAESARIGSIFARRGLATDFGVAYWLPRIVGAARAFDILFDGQPYGAQEALALGLVNRVVPDAALMDETLAYAKKIAAGAPMAMTATRRLVMASLDGTNAEVAAIEWQAQWAILQSEDGREGFRAFLEKRPPAFKGR